MAVDEEVGLIVVLILVLVLQHLLGMLFLIKHQADLVEVVIILLKLQETLVEIMQEAMETLPL